MTGAAGRAATPGDTRPGRDTPPPRAVTHRRERLAGPDVTRALALLGVIALNYHGYLNRAEAAAGPGSSLAERWFDPWRGVLATRFAATFVLVAGIGVSLLTEASRTSGDRSSRSDDRWRLVRRGVLLWTVGFFLDWIWPGTILFFTGAMLVVAAALFTLRTRWLVVAGTAAALAAAGVRAWVLVRERAGRPPAWLLEPDTLETRSPRGLLLDTFVNGAHPLLPWLAFLCAGMVLGRHLAPGRAPGPGPGSGSVRFGRLAVVGSLLTAASYAASHLLTNGSDDGLRTALWSTRPFDRGLLYTIGTLGSSLAAVALVSIATERFGRARAVRALRAVGETSLSIYLAHVVVFRLVVDRAQLVRPTGLDTALVFALGVWAVAALLAVRWRHRHGLGPAERVLRRFGG
jgi:uncharacterized protein